ncbi:hypothetical protein Cadr_000019152 [Camelus dromedarius]|uniref:Uncharacterized protein n=1 Tax=Camelus dromedarius TaxID=9838 RepID=A0A5N4D210_CAMDR|nr:hypothetical protein Cadr_000019152 [Camelus dromedarius]
MIQLCHPTASRMTLASHPSSPCRMENKVDLEAFRGYQDHPPRPSPRGGTLPKKMPMFSETAGPAVCGQDREESGAYLLAFDALTVNHRNTTSELLAQA